MLVHTSTAQLFVCAAARCERVGAAVAFAASVGAKNRVSASIWPLSTNSSGTRYGWVSNTTYQSAERYGERGHQGDHECLGDAFANLSRRHQRVGRRHQIDTCLVQLAPEPEPGDEEAEADTDE